MDDIKVVTKFNADLIEQSVSGFEQYGASFLAKEIIKLRDEGVRTALIELGWTPPKDDTDA